MDWKIENRYAFSGVQMIPDLLALASLPGMNQHLLVALCSKAYSTPLICCKLDSQALKSKQILLNAIQVDVIRQ
jgi:hypothetical protein